MHRLGRGLIHFLALGFGAGRSPIAPGTCGTLVAVPIFFLLRELGPAVYVAVTVTMFVLGVWMCDVAERDLGAQDAPSIVWDEIVGYLIAMLGAPNGWEWVLVGFLLFRLFDIAKPFPIRAFERRLPGGFGIMFDDVLAAAYVCLTWAIAARVLG